MDMLFERSKQVPLMYLFSSLEPPNTITRHCVTLHSQCHHLMLHCAISGHRVRLYFHFTVRRTLPTRQDFPRHGNDDEATLSRLCDVTCRPIDAAAHFI